jgi:hypothetical protein
MVNKSRVNVSSRSRGEDGGQPLVHRQLDGRAVRHQVFRLAGAGPVAPRDHLPVRVDDAALAAAAHAQARLDPDRLHLEVLHVRRVHVRTVLHLEHEPEHVPPRAIPDYSCIQVPIGELQRDNYKDESGHGEKGAHPKAEL